MPATTEARTALTLVQAPTAPAASRVDSVMAAQAAANNALNADATEVEAHVTTTARHALHLHWYRQQQQQLVVSIASWLQRQQQTMH